MTITSPDISIKSLWPRLRTPQQTRIANLLAPAGITTIGALANRSADDLHVITGIGGSSLTEIRRALAKHGLSLRGEAGERP